MGRATDASEPWTKPGSRRGSPDRIHQLLGKLVTEIEYGIANGLIPESIDFSFVIRPSIVGTDWVVGGKVMTGPMPEVEAPRLLTRASEQFGRPRKET